MSKAEDSIILYLTQMGYDPDTTYLRYEGGETVTVETPEGSQKLSLNQSGDIVELSQDGSEKIIAVSGGEGWIRKEGEAV